MPGHQPHRRGHQAAPARLRVGPVADLALDPGRPVEPQDRAEQPVVVGVGDRPGDALAGGLELAALLDVLERVVERVRRRELPEPALAVRVRAALVDPRRVVHRDRPQPEAVALQHRNVEPGRPRLARVVLEQRADPGVAPGAALGEVAAQGALDRDPEPPGQLPARPVAGEGLPDDRSPGPARRTPSPRAAAAPAASPRCRARPGATRRRSRRDPAPRRAARRCRRTGPRARPRTPTPSPRPTSPARRAARTPRRPTRRTASAPWSTRPTPGPGTARPCAARPRPGAPAASRRRRSGSVRWSGRACGQGG